MIGRLLAERRCHQAERRSIDAHLTVLTSPGVTASTRASVERVLADWRPHDCGDRRCRRHDRERA